MKMQINFKQERDFGELFNVSFEFIKQESRNLWKAVLYFILPVLIIVSIFQVLLGMEQQKVMQSFGAYDPYAMQDPFSYLGSVFWYLVIAMILYAVTYTVIKCTLLGYVKLYVEKGKDEFGLNELWKEIRTYFFPVLVTSVFVGILISIGTVFCFIPGIYLGVSLSLIYMALIFEDKGFGNALSRSFELTHHKWWLTLGLLAVSYIMIYLISLILSLPAIITGIKPILTNLKDMEDPSSFTFPTAYFIMTSITNLITYILLAIPSLIMAFHYYSLIESKDKPSLEEKIGQINENEM